MSKQRDVEQHSRPPVSDDALGRRSVIAALAAAGIASPIMFAVVGLAFLVLSGVGLVWVGLFPSTDAAGARWDDRVLHIVAFPMTFLGAGIGLIVMSRRMAGDPRWRSLATYALATGIVVLVLLLAGGGLVRAPGAPLHPWWSLFQWVLLAVWFPCTVVLALRLLRVARAAETPR